MRYRGTISWKILMVTAACGAGSIALRAALDVPSGNWVWATLPALIAVGGIFAIGAGVMHNLLHGLMLALALPLVGVLWAILMMRAHHVGPAMSVVFGLFAIVSLVLGFKDWGASPPSGSSSTGGHAAGHH